MDIYFPPGSVLVFSTDSILPGPWVHLTMTATLFQFRDAHNSGLTVISHSAGFLLSLFWTAAPRLNNHSQVQNPWFFASITGEPILIWCLTGTIFIFAVLFPPPCIRCERASVIAVASNPAVRGPASVTVPCIEISPKVATSPCSVAVRYKRGINVVTQT